MGLTSRHLLQAQQLTCAPEDDGCQAAICILSVISFFEKSRVLGHQKQHPMIRPLVECTTSYRIAPSVLAPLYYPRVLGRHHPSPHLLRQ